MYRHPLFIFQKVIFIRIYFLFKSLIKTMSINLSKVNKRNKILLFDKNILKKVNDNDIIEKIGGVIWKLEMKKIYLRY